MSCAVKLGNLIMKQNKDRQACVLGHLVVTWRTDLLFSSFWFSNELQSKSKRFVVLLEKTHHVTISLHFKITSEKWRQHLEILNVSFSIKKKKKLFLWSYSLTIDVFANVSSLSVTVFIIPVSVVVSNHLSTVFVALPVVRLALTPEPDSKQNHTSGLSVLRSPNCNKISQSCCRSLTFLQWL